MQWINFFLNKTNIKFWIFSVTFLTWAVDGFYNYINLSISSVFEKDPIMIKAVGLKLADRPRTSRAYQDS